MADINDHITVTSGNEEIPSRGVGNPTVVTSNKSDKSEQMPSSAAQQVEYDYIRNDSRKADEEIRTLLGDLPTQVVAASTGVEEIRSSLGDLPSRIVSADMGVEEQRKLKTDAAEKIEEVRQEKLAIKVDVVYHFFCYRYFDRSATCLEMINFVDSDVDIFNLTCNKTRGLDNWHVCAKYMNDVGNATPETNTHRRRFIHKVRSFNKTQPSHFRFYLQNLTDDDIAYIRALIEEDKKAEQGIVSKQTALMWASSMVEDEVSVAFDCQYTSKHLCDPMELSISEALFAHEEKLRAKANLKVYDTEKKAVAHRNSIETVHNPFPGHIEKLAINNIPVDDSENVTPGPATK